MSQPADTARPPKPLPVPDGDSRPFWEACRAERFVLPRCGECGCYHFYPRAVCPYCHGASIAWEPASGEGTIYTFTVARRPAGPAFADDVPYVIALIDLAEGPRMMCNVLAGDVDAVRIGQRVRVTFRRASEEITLPQFVPQD